jgi:hypothetical protein
MVLTNLGIMYQDEKQPDAARTHLHEALTDYRSLAQSDGKYAGNVGTVEAILRQVEK